MRVLASAAAAAGLCATALVSAGPASAVTEQCANYKSPDKVELSYETTTLQLPAGSTVCYKAGTQVFTVVVPDDGILTSAATNKWGKPLAFSYYIPSETPPPPLA
jgi:hypothetical protein